MTQPQADGQQRVVTAYQQQASATQAQLAAAIVALWASLPDYRNASMRDFARQAVPLVEAAMGHMQASTAAYLATLLAAQGVGSGVPLATSALTVSAVRNGVDPADVYERPFHAVWRALGSDVPLQSAVDVGRARAVKLAATDLQLAKTHTSRAVVSKTPRAVGYRRVLEGAYSCGLCVVASTRRYKKDELMPMHPACDCSVAPIVGDQDPGHVVNQGLLVAAHDAVAERFGADSTAAQKIAGAVKDDGSPLLYRDVLITHEHGELGPILAVRGQGWRGPSDLTTTGRGAARNG